MQEKDSVKATSWQLERAWHEGKLKRHLLFSVTLVDKILKRSSKPSQNPVMIVMGRSE